MVFRKRSVIDATIVLMKHFEFKFKTTKQRNFVNDFWYSIKVLKLTIRLISLETDSLYFNSMRVRTMPY